ncbi:transcriptional regulator LysR family (plasmid) [Cupriavidus necator N-1]|uniref:Transcriptional regulator LysR family n=1 Tax=Cupriavidus necator (strain ATCC 43291 / DSM 13513 / CCUG 52238 / LMG 8453 / N-1) TaxID=1042878 RepID=F8GVV0_CUPNN|nr:LysR family transcriptional regulator [Cupriavidus necator]AEI81592.1 transcriptional regulator LysR family [Cupriavidus necator N-1]MDX6007962.1 LysR family transcriptional regulator [Cupriavidus necator]
MAVATLVFRSFTRIRVALFRQALSCGHLNGDVEPEIKSGKSISPSALDRLGNVDFHTLFALAALLRGRSVSRAAAQMEVSQPAMSRTLDRLRIVFQDALLVREGNHMLLTAHGKELLPIVEKLLETTAQLAGVNAPFDAATQVRHFSLACNEHIQLSLAPSLLTALRTAAPSITAQFSPLHRSGAVDALASGELDLCIGSAIPSAPGIHTSLLYSEAFVCVMRKPRHTGGKVRISLKDFCALPHLDVSPTGLTLLGELINRTIRKQGGSRQVVYTISSFMAAPQIVSETDMICAIPARTARRLALPDNVVVAELAFEAPATDVSMYWHNLTHRDAACDWLRAEIRRALPAR